MDDIDQQTLNEEVVEPNLETSSVEEPSSSEEIVTPDTEATAQVPETSIETEESPKKGAQKRIQELVTERNTERERAKSLEQQLAELTGSVEPTVPQGQYTPQFDSNEIDPVKYQQEVVKSAVSAAQLVVKQGEAINRINNEATQVIRKYPELDPDNAAYDPELSEMVTKQTLKLVKAEPYTASPKSIVEELMRPYKRLVTKEVGKARENIAKQVSQTATRPTSVSTGGGKSHQEKSIAELEAELGIVQS
jgi:hypothetical protein